ncbi:MAG: shikimate kinase [Thermoanaerobaculia bacterium]|nr:shikimate kinase [Thermoanaerobaculia bacterium]
MTASGLPSRIYLVGFMGSGKTRIGHLLADALGHGFLDVDALVQEDVGMSIREIFEQEGEAWFRARETHWLRRTDEWDDVVVATGGGAMVSEANRRLLQERGATVWLNVPFDVIVERMGAAGHAQRPLLDDEKRARQLYSERLPAYRRADMEVPVQQNEEASQVAARILDLIHSGT